MYKSLFIYIILIYSVRYDIMAKIHWRLGYHVYIQNFDKS